MTDETKISLESTRGNTLALKIVELYEERDALKSAMDFYKQDLAKSAERYRKCEGLLEAYRSFYGDIHKAVTSENSYDSIIKTIEGAVRSMQGIDEEYEKILDEAGIKRLDK